MSGPLKVLFTLLLVAALAGMAFSAWAVMQIRADLAALTAKVSQLERRPAADPGAPPRETDGLPSGQPSAASLPAPSEIDALRRQVADLSTRVHALSSGAPHGTAVPSAPDGAPATAGGVALPAPSGPTFDDATREAVKDLVRETLAEEGSGAVATVSFSGPVMKGFHDIDALGKELGLSETQKTEIEKAWALQDQEMASFFEQSGELPDPEAMKAQMQEMGRKTDERIKQLLTVEQARKYDEMRPERGDSVFFGVKTREAPAPKK